MFKKNCKKCTFNFVRIEILLFFGVPDNQIWLHFGVPNNQFSFHFGVPDNQISLHFEVPDNCSFMSSGGVRQNRSLANSSTPQTKEHWGSHNKLRITTILYIVHCTLYNVHCTLFTVNCTLYTFPSQLFPPTFPHNFPHNCSHYFSTQLFHTFFLYSCPINLFTKV